MKGLTVKELLPTLNLIEILLDLVCNEPFFTVVLEGFIN